MRSRAAVLAMGAVLLLIAGCEQGTGSSTPDPTRSSSTPSSNNVSAHESGPDSPIAYGFQVPSGATQVGPLVRYRSTRLINAYKTELDAARAQRDAEQQRRRTEAEAEGTPLPPPSPTPTTEPSDDTFKLLDSPPKPDTTVSLMRIDGSRTDAVRRMLVQIDAVLPDAGVETGDISQYCEARDRRITGCSLRVKGRTANERDLRVTLTVDPGNVRTRTSPPATNGRPVMTFEVAYVGDPRRGQVDRQGDGNVDVPNALPQPDATDLIWPKMDEDASLADPLFNRWRAPLGSTVLLSGFGPAFVAVATDKALDADHIASQFVESVSDEPAKDVVEDLNEITTTYTAKGKNGERAMASYILSARGYYAMLFYTPPDTK